MVKTEIVFADEEEKMLVELAYRTAPVKRTCMMFRIFFIGLGIFLTVLSAGCFSDGDYLTALIGFAAAAFSFFMGVSMGKIQKSKGLKQTRKNMEQTGVRSVAYTFDEEGIHSVSAAGENIFNWNTLACYGTLGHYLWIQRKDTAVVLVDKSKTAAEDIAAIEKWLTENCVIRDSSRCD